MLGAWVREAHGRRAVREILELVDVAALERLVRPRVELGRPGRRGRIDTEIAKKGQTMGQEAAADDQHALVAQWPEPAPDVVEPLRIEARHRYLQHGNLCIRVHDGKRDIGPVVQSPIGLIDDRLVGDELADLRRQLGRAWRSVLRTVVALGESPEVIGQWGTGSGRADRERRVLPVR